MLTLQNEESSVVKIQAKQCPPPAKVCETERGSGLGPEATRALHKSSDRSLTTRAHAKRHVIELAGYAICVSGKPILPPLDGAVKAFFCVPRSIVIEIEVHAHE